MDEVESFHFIMEGTLSVSQNGLSIKLPMYSEGDFAKPDRYRGLTAINLGFSQIETEFVVISDEFYTLDTGSGQWTKIDGPSALMLLNPVDLVDTGKFAKQDEFAELDDLRIVGQEVIGNTDSHHLAFSLTDWEYKDQESLSGDIEMGVWIGVDDGYLYRVAIGGQFSIPEGMLSQFGASQLEGFGTGELDATVILSRFNVPVVIEPPAITVVATPGPISKWTRLDLKDEGISISAPRGSVIEYLDTKDVWRELRIDHDDIEDFADLFKSPKDRANLVLLADELADRSFAAGFGIVTNREAFYSGLDPVSLEVRRINVRLPAVRDVVSQSVDTPEGSAYRLTFTLSDAPAGDDDSPDFAILYLLLYNSEHFVVIYSVLTEDVDAQDQVFQSIIDTLKISEAFDPPYLTTPTPVPAPVVLTPTPVSSPPPPDSSPTPAPNQPRAVPVTPTSTPLTKGNPQMAQQYSSPPAMVIDTSKAYTAIFTMEDGSKFEIGLFAKEAPNTVNNFIFLAREGFYDSTTFHRVIPGFMAQGGDPTGTGRGGPGYRFNDEFDRGLRHDKPGVLSMANAGPNTNGSQFFITFVATPHLNDRHAVFGEVTEGMDVVNAISARDPATASTPGDVIASITISES